MSLKIDDSDFLRFTDKLLISDECWGWISNGDPKHYPKFKISKGVGIDAHRLSYQLFKGQIPDGYCVCHTCDNRRCANPSHLFVGTAQDNAVDATRKGRITPPRVAKLLDFQVAQIKRALREGKTHAAIALEFGVSRSTISNIAQGRCWQKVG
jgi:hypothetical protein